MIFNAVYFLCAASAGRQPLLNTYFMHPHYTRHIKLAGAAGYRLRADGVAPSFHWLTWCRGCTGQGAALDWGEMICAEK